MHPRARRAGADTREHILDAAVCVVQNVGLGRATTKEIARAAGLSEAALYRHFADKTDLVLCMMGERVPRLASALQDLPARVGRRTVRANLEELVRLALSSYQQAVPVAAALFADPDLLARHQAHLRSNNVAPRGAVEHLAAYIRAEQRLGRVGRRADPEAAAWLLLGPCIGRTLVRRFIGDELDAEADERFIKTLLHTLVLALAPDKRA
jgi:AcrR family transcriptional regulator